MVIGESFESNVSFCHNCWHQILQTSLYHLYGQPRHPGFSFCLDYLHQRLHSSVSVGFTGHRDRQAQVSVRTFGSSVGYCSHQLPSALLAAETRRHQFLPEFLTGRPSGESMCQNCQQQILQSLVSVNITGTSVFWLQFMSILLAAEAVRCHFRSELLAGISLCRLSVADSIVMSPILQDVP